ncbi:MAG: MFS transporter [bacterium]|nr:MFS transporter [Candidatus Sumerlaeota bacterium]
MQAEHRSVHFRDIFNTAVFVAALGYFVDIYDLVLFGIVRVPSLKSLGLSGDAVLNQGLFLLNMQMAGMLIGGIVFGIIGDKKGRLSLLFGSIFLYSIANVANAYVSSIGAYAALRFVAGVGLAGELGGGITLVAEILSKEARGYGTMIVASVGVAGAVLAYWVAEKFDWRMAYLIGGVLGLMLLALRIGMFESGMFRQIKQQGIQRGKFIALFTNKKRFVKYLKCILIGLPSWYVVGILLTLSPEFSKEMKIAGDINAGRAIMFCYLGLIPGDVISGVLSQWMKSRKKIVWIFMFVSLAFIIWYYLSWGVRPALFYLICFGLGLGIGYWAVFVTIAAEQFGTNMRATVATTVPNFVRGAVIPITLSFDLAKHHLGIIGGGIVVGIACMALAFWALHRMEETFGKELDYVELM